MFYAIRYLKPIQIYGQIRNRIVARTFSRRFWIKRGESVQLGDCVWRPSGEFLPPGPQQNSQADMLAGRLTFLNQEKRLGWPFDWTPPNVSKLWEYNLHYFEYIFALDYENAKFLVLDWIEKYPLARNADGWEPYPVSLRLMNWTAFFLGRHRAQTLADEFFCATLKLSTATQAEWLLYRREFHLLANHYLENAASLAFVGSCFEGPDAKQFFQIGLDILKRELSAQILTDGMHFERSPMYHSRVVYLFKLLLDTGNAELIELVGPYHEKAASALSKLCHPDGQIALLNDAAFGIYNEPKQLCAVTENDAETFSLPHAGYYGANTKAGHYIICDAGEIGPAYNPGHGHGDIFSFELSIYGKRIIVDSGTYNYVNSPERRYSRSTSAHNTVEIDGLDQCEFFDAFKVGCRAYPKNVRWQETQNGFTLEGEHDGYKRLPAKAIHHRRFEWQHRGTLEIVDRIDARRPVAAISRFHLHPDCNVTALGDNEAAIRRDEIRCRLHIDGSSIRLGHYDYSPEFGKKLPATMIEISVSSSQETIRTTITSEPGT